MIISEIKDIVWLWILDKKKKTSETYYINDFYDFFFLVQFIPRI